VSLLAVLVWIIVLAAASLSVRGGLAIVGAKHALPDGPPTMSGRVLLSVTFSILRQQSTGHGAINRCVDADD
jgi:hypothetical protein